MLFATFHDAAGKGTRQVSSLLMVASRASQDDVLKAGIGNESADTSIFANELVRLVNWRTQETVEDERVAEGPAVAEKRRNGRGAKGPCCFVIPLAMTGGRGVL